MNTLRVQSKSGLLLAIPFGLLFGGPYIWIGSMDLYAGICRFADGRTIGDAAAMLPCLPFVVAGLLICCGIALCATREPYEIQLADRGPLDVISWLGRKRLWPEEIIEIRTMIQESEDSETRLIRVFDRWGRQVDLPQFDRSEDLISLLTARNPSIAVHREW